MVVARRKSWEVDASGVRREVASVTEWLEDRSFDLGHDKAPPTLTRPTPLLAKRTNHASACEKPDNHSTIQPSQLRHASSPTRPPSPSVALMLDCQLDAAERAQAGAQGETKQDKPKRKFIGFSEQFRMQQEVARNRTGPDSWLSRKVS